MQGPNEAARNLECSPSGPVGPTKCSLGHIWCGGGGRSVGYVWFRGGGRSVGWTAFRGLEDSWLMRLQAQGAQCSSKSHE